MSMRLLGRTSPVLLASWIISCSFTEADRSRDRDSQRNPICIGWADGWTLFEYSPTKKKWETEKAPPDLLAGSYQAFGDRSVMRLSRTTYAGSVFNVDTRAWEKIPESPIRNEKGAALGTTSIVGEKLVVFADTRRPPHGAAFDLRTKQWQQIAKAPIRPRHRGARVVIGKVVFYWGGYGPGFDPTVPDARGPLTDGAMYDAEKDEWEMLPESPLKFNAVNGKEMYGMAWCVWEGKFVIVGGRDHPKGMMYDPGTRKWERIPAADFPGTCHPACAVVRDQLFLWSGDERMAERGFIYDFRMKVWKETSKAPIPGRQLAFAHPFAGKVYVWGGWVPAQQGPKQAEFIASGAVYDVATDTWEKISDMPGVVPYELHPGW